MNAAAETHEIKKAIRALALERRDSIPLPVRRAKDAMLMERLFGLHELHSCSNMLCYASFRSEAATGGIIEHALRLGKTVSLPRCHPEGCELSLHAIRSLSDLSLGYRGIPEPPDADAAAIDPSIIDMALVPGVAFTPEGVRIGYGKGYYDRLLSALLGCAPIVALAYEEQIVEDIPAEAHDVRVDIIVTDKRTIRCHG